MLRILVELDPYEADDLVSILTRVGSPRAVELASKVALAAKDAICADMLYQKDDDM